MLNHLSGLLVEKVHMAIVIIKLKSKVIFWLKGHEIMLYKGPVPEFAFDEIDYLSYSFIF